MFYHFEFTSGSNPYIAFTEEKAKKARRAWTRKGYNVETVRPGFYRVHDMTKKTAGTDGPQF